MEIFRSPPPWYGALYGPIGGLGMMCGIAILLMHWGVWLIFTNAIWSPWGVAIGWVVIIAELMALFDRMKDSEVCDVPPPGDGPAGAGST